MARVRGEVNLWAQRPAKLFLFTFFSWSSFAFATASAAFVLMESISTAFVCVTSWSSSLRFLIVAPSALTSWKRANKRVGDYTCWLQPPLMSGDAGSRISSMGITREIRHSPQGAENIDVDHLMFVEVGCERFGKCYRRNSMHENLQHEDMRFYLGLRVRVFLRSCDYV